MTLRHMVRWTCAALLCARKSLDWMHLLCSIMS